MITREQQVRNGVMYLMPVIVGSSLPLLTLPVYTRVLSSEEYGAWALAMAYGMFVTGVANFGLTLGYERNFFEHRDTDSRAKLLYTTVAFVIAAFTATVLATWVFRARIADLIIGSPAHATLLLCTLCAQAVMSLKTYFLIFFRNTGQARSHVWYSVDELVGASVLGVIFVGWFRIGVIGIPLGQLIASVAVFGALTWRFVREMPVAFSGPLLREELAISYPLTPRILLGVVGTQMDKYLLGLLGTLGGVGVFTVAQRLAQIVFTYMTALENVFTPQVYDRMFKLGAQGGASVGAYLTPFAYVSTVAALGLGLFAEEAILLLTPPEFHGAIPLAAILCLHYGLMFFGKLPQLVYAKKTGIISAMTFVTIGVNTGLNILLIRQWGAMGAATGTLLAGIVSLVLVLVIGQRYYPIQWQYGPLTAIFGVLFAGVIGIVWMHQTGFGYGPRFAFKLGALAAYALVGVQLRILTRDNFLMARSALMQRFAVPAS